MTIKPWRDVIAPHRDVLEGTFEEAKFAADLTQVVEGVAVPEYQDPQLFFERTYITEGMSLLLQSVLKRLSGKGGAPVVQLQTAFGGGKTHTMMAVLHVARAEVPADKLTGIPEILAKAGVSELPRGRVAVLDGNALAPSHPRIHDGITVHTLWGELAYQLGRADGYAIVAQSDRDGTSPGKAVLAELFRRFPRSVVLLDETVAYLRQLEPGKSYPGGSYNSNLSFIQALTEAAASAPSTMVLGSLPESMMEIGDHRAKDTLDALEKYFGRIEAVWKPVATEEAFEIVRRRLFGPVTDTQARAAVCRAFAEMYSGDDKDSFPAEARDAGYERKLLASYPIHPEVFERLYEDWSTLPRFQRTRGVLRLMAHIIHRLWRADNRDYLIMPGSISLDDVSVRNELVKYLASGWDPIVERDIDGNHAQTRQMDDSTPALGSLQACRRAARTIFLGSAPSVAEQKVRGIGIERVRLGCVQPGQPVGRYDDALRRLQDSLHYLYSGNERFWFDLRPNLRREMEDRMQRFDTAVHMNPEIKKRLESLVKRGIFQAVHVFPSSQDVPDKTELRLVVLEPDAAHRQADMGSAAVRAARAIVDKHGERTREMQNRLMFLAADRDAVPALRDDVRRYLAWHSIYEDREMLNLDTHHTKESKRSLDKARQRVEDSVQAAYRWLLVPVQEVKRNSVGDIAWEDANVAAGSGTIAGNIEQITAAKEWVIAAWAPMFLQEELQRWYWKPDRPTVSAVRVWEDLCKYLYLPRLASRDVLIETIRNGVEHEDFFGYATAEEGSDADRRFVGLLFGKGGAIYLESSAVLIEPSVAKAAKKPESVITAAGSGDSDTALPLGNAGGQSRGDRAREIPKPVSTNAKTAVMRRFHAVVELNPLNADLQLGNIMENVVEHFTAQYGTAVNITVDIEAIRKEGFDADMQRVVRENCATLKFKSAEFEEE